MLYGKNSIGSLDLLTFYKVASKSADLDEKRAPQEGYSF
jgi:hypothetical protein